MLASCFFMIHVLPLNAEAHVVSFIMSNSITIELNSAKIKSNVQSKSCPGLVLVTLISLTTVVYVHMATQAHCVK